MTATFLIASTIGVTAAHAAETAPDKTNDVLAELDAMRVGTPNEERPELPPLVTAAAFSTRAGDDLLADLYDPADIAADPQLFLERFPETQVAAAEALTPNANEEDWGNCSGSDSDYNTNPYRGSYVNAYSYIYVTWNGNVMYGCANSAHPSDDKYWHDGNGYTKWLGLDPYNADTVSIAVNVKAPGWGVESLSISASDVGLTLSSSSNDNKLFEGTLSNIWSWSFNYNNEYVDLGGAGQVWNIEQKVSGTFTFIYSGGVAETVSTSAYADVNV